MQVALKVLLVAGKCGHFLCSIGFILTTKNLASNLGLNHQKSAAPDAKSESQWEIGDFKQKKLSKLDRTMGEEAKLEKPNRRVSGPSWEICGSRWLYCVSPLVSDLSLHDIASTRTPC